jgi:site-specific DNA-methyltransferase (adenine-specific)
MFAEWDRRFSFTLDVCADAGNAKCANYYTRADDGLAQPWAGRVWCNPPYGREIGRWVAKAAESVRAGDAEVVVCLLPARTDTSWWHTYCAGAEVHFLRGRVRFGEAETGAPFPSAVVTFRNGRGVTKPPPADGPITDPPDTPLEGSTDE